MNVKIGLSKKIGQPDFGSIGATCQIEIDLADTDFGSASFQDRVRGIFESCRQSVDEELERNRLAHEPVNSSNGRYVDDERGQRQVRMSSDVQRRAIDLIARKQSVDLPDLLQNRFQVDRLDQLDIRQASSLIDELKARLVQS